MANKPITPVTISLIDKNSSILFLFAKKNKGNLVENLYFCILYFVFCIYKLKLYCRPNKCLCVL